ncbi:RNA polymerase sigma-70 factor [Fibrella forsythiae]|nr:RNA polymerase sigma-70 factor [Fibrella forsythiae]
MPHLIPRSPAPLTTNNVQQVDTIAHPLMLDDEVLVAQLMKTDPEQGCSWLFRRYYTLLCNHALRYVYSREVAEDIVGEVFCTLWTNKLYETITTSYRAYLFVAVRNKSLNYLRWELDRSAVGTDVFGDASAAVVATDLHTPAEVVQFDELYQKINEAIAVLPPQCRRSFLLSRFEQKSYRDIAEEMGISVKAVEANISRALTALRNMLRNEFVVALLLATGLI